MKAPAAIFLVAVVVAAPAPATLPPAAVTPTLPAPAAEEQAEASTPDSASRGWLEVVVGAMGGRAEIGGDRVVEVLIVMGTITLPRISDDGRDAEVKDADSEVAEKEEEVAPATF